MSEPKKDMTQAVDKAIEQVLGGGQSYRIGERQLQRADLDKLLRARRELRSDSAQAEAEPEAFPGVSVCRFDRR